jgi:hypothetical protein
MLITVGKPASPSQRKPIHQQLTTFAHNPDPTFAQEKKRPVFQASLVLSAGARHSLLWLRPYAFFSLRQYSSGL